MTNAKMFWVAVVCLAAWTTAVEPLSLLDAWVAVAAIAVFIRAQEAWRARRDDQ